MAPSALQFIRAAQPDYAEQLYEQTKNCFLIEADNMIKVNPWEFTEEKKRLEEEARKRGK